MFLLPMIGRQIGLNLNVSKWFDGGLFSRIADFE